MTNLRAPEDQTLRVQGLPTADNRWSVQCLNCEVPLHGRFCSACGQRAVPPHPTVRELAGDALGEFTGWDGKLAETVRTLLLKPGELTRQWLDGRRVHFISPLRLYLTASILFFVVQTSAPTLDKQARAGFSVDTRTNPGRASTVAAKAMSGDDALSAAEKDSALVAAAKAPAVLRPLLERMITDPEGLKSSLRQLVPRLFFALLPFYAGILMLFYRRRNYPDHLYFAIHLHAFVFIALLTADLAKFTYQVKLAIGVGIAAMVWIALYSLFALRRVYGGGWAGTVGKSIGIMALYGLVAVPMMLVTIYLAALL